MKASTTPKVSLSVGAAGLQPFTCGMLIPPAEPEPDCAELDDAGSDAVALEEGCASETVPLEDGTLESVTLDVALPDGVSVAELDGEAFSLEDNDKLPTSLEGAASDDEISETCDSVSGELALLLESLPQAHRKNETNPKKIFFFMAYKITLNCGNGSIFILFYTRKMCVK